MFGAAADLLVPACRPVFLTCFFFAAAMAMTYTDLDALTKEVSQEILEKLAPDGAGGIDTDVVDEANKKAVDEVHGYLRGVYTLPLDAPVDGLIELTVNEITQYQLYKSVDAATVPDLIVKLYDGALKRLDAIRKREITIDAEEDLGGDDDNPATFKVISPDAKFPAGFTKQF